MHLKLRTRQFLARYWKFILLALLMYMPLFGHLDDLPLRDYDEGLNAMNAYEMYKNGDWIVVHHNHSPDMYNTKPALLRWAQVICMKIIGVNDLAVRLPSAFSGFFTCIAMLLLCTRFFRNDLLGIITVLALITTNGYIHSHVTRTADFDAMLTLFTTISAIFFFIYCETHQNKFLYLFFVALALAVLTKGIAGLLFGPALLIYALVKKIVIPLLKNRHFYGGLILFLGLAGGYYLLRDVKNPGYFVQVLENEVGGRYLENPGNQVQDFWFYAKKLLEFQVADRYFLIPCGLLLGLFSRNRQIRDFSLFAGIVAVTHFLILSAGQTRLEQYIAPLFPFFAWMVAVFVEFIFRWLKESEWLRANLTVNAAPVLFLIMVSVTPYVHIFNKTYSPTETYSWDKEYYEIGHFYKDALRGKVDLNGKMLLYDGWDPHIMFYVHALQENGVHTGKVISPEFLNPGMTIVVYQEQMKRLLRDWFIVKETKVMGKVSYFKLLRRC